MEPHILLRAALTVLAISVASGCAANTGDADAEDSTDALSQSAQSATVALPPCVVTKLPEGDSIRMLIAPKYTFVIEGSALEKAGVSHDGSVTISRRTRGELLPLGKMNASSGEVAFEIPRGDLTDTTYVLDFGSSAHGPLSAAAKADLGSIYSVLVMKKGLLGDAIVKRCEAPGA
ncbi:MAG TPA: hypothetical protein VLT33_14035 [Labilithrix sp.]|nr:hypothetical protein [Labilithrix sp.]